MKECRIWKDTLRDGEAGLLIPENEVEKAILTDDMVLILRGVDVGMINTLNAKLAEYLRSDDGDRIHFVSDMEEFLEWAGIEGVTVESADMYVDPESVVAFHTEEQIFWNLQDTITTDIYRWWDGRNMRTVECGVNTIETRLVISDDYVSLDEWDGRNMTTGGMGYHARIYRVLKLDGEVPEESTFLLNRWSQWQGDHETGEILTLDELPGVLESLDRDPKEYMPKIEALKNE